MKTIVSVALAGLVGLNLVGCGDEIKSVEEFSKLSKEKLVKLKSEKCDDEVEGEVARKFSSFTRKIAIAKTIDKNPSEYSKKLVECARIMIVLEDVK